MAACANLAPPQGPWHLHRALFAVTPRAKNAAASNPSTINHLQIPQRALTQKGTQVRCTQSQTKSSGLGRYKHAVGFMPCHWSMERRARLPMC